MCMFTTLKVRAKFELRPLSKRTAMPVRDVLGVDRRERAD